MVCIFFAHVSRSHFVSVHRARSLPPNRPRRTGAHTCPHSVTATCKSRDRQRSRRQLMNGCDATLSVQSRPVVRVFVRVRVRPRTCPRFSGASSRPREIVIIVPPTSPTTWLCRQVSTHALFSTCGEYGIAHEYNYPCEGRIILYYRL